MQKKFWPLSNCFTFWSTIVFGKGEQWCPGHRKPGPGHHLDGEGRAPLPPDRLHHHRRRADHLRVRRDEQPVQSASGARLLSGGWSWKNNRDVDNILSRLGLDKCCWSTGLVAPRTTTPALTRPWRTACGSSSPTATTTWTSGRRSRSSCTSWSWRPRFTQTTDCSSSSSRQQQKSSQGITLTTDHFKKRKIWGNIFAQICVAAQLCGLFGAAQHRGWKF